MKFVPIVNHKLISILDNFKNEVLNKDFNFENEKIGTLDKVYACSPEFLEEAKLTPMLGLSNDSYLKSVAKDDINLKLKSDLAEWNKHRAYIVANPGRASLRFETFQACALAAVYPPDGFMGWHNNHDAPGHNVLFTWTENGQGFFRYQDPKTKEIVTMNDKPGWTCKVGYFGHYRENDKIFWHSCSADELRISIGWIFPTLQASDDFINQVQQH